jgi:hypothetical protein
MTKKEQAVEQVLHYTRPLLADDLVEIGGEDLRGRNSKKARHVERVWALMAKLELTHNDVCPRKRRHRTPSLKLQ